MEDTLFYCEICNQQLTQDEVYMMMETVLCSDCYATHFVCQDCGAVIHENDVYTYRDEVYCEDCYRSREEDDESYLNVDMCREIGIITDASGKKFYIGIELEFETRRSPYDSGIIGENLFYKYDNYIYSVRRDASLSSSGLEIGTLPVTYDDHKEQLPVLIRDLRNLLEAYADDTNAGLHINIDKRCLTRLEIYKFILIFNKLFEFLQVFTRRYNITRYCHYYSTDIAKKAILEKITTEKFSSINIHKNRYEFRIFKGTIRYERIMSYVEFILLLKEFVNKYSIREITNFNFNELLSLLKDYINKSKFSNLKTFFNRALSQYETA